MANSLHYQVQVDQAQSVQVSLNAEARIYLVDDKNYQRLRAHERFRYYGRSQSLDNVVIRPNKPGTWHVVISGARSAIHSAEVTLID